VRRIVAADSTALRQPRSRNEHFELPLQFAVHRNKPKMVALLLELGADPRWTDGNGSSASAYVSFPGVKRATVDALARGGIHDLVLALIVGDAAVASRIWERRASFDAKSVDAGALHLLAKRGELKAVQWLLERGADPNARWDHWDALVTPLHLVCWPPETKDRRRILELLLDAGGDPSIRDSMHDGDARGWAEHMGLERLMKILDDRQSGT
jgi:ankyrin repeat protein